MEPRLNQRWFVWFAVWLVCLAWPLPAMHAARDAASAVALIEERKFSEAAVLLSPLVERKDADALLLQGLLEATGAGAIWRPHGAQGRWKQAAHLGQRDAIRLLWPALPEDFQRTWWRERLVSTPESSLRLPGNLARREGDRVVLDERDAVTWIEENARGGDALALFNLYVLRKRQPEWMNSRKDELVAILHRSANAGYAPALHEISNLYEDDLPGAGNRMRLLPANAKVSNNYLQRAADQGDSVAQLSWALRRSSDQNGAERNPALVVEYARRASDQGAAFAAYLLYEAYAEGQGVEKNQALALDFLKLAASRDDPAGATRLAHRLFYGQGMPADEAAAIPLLVRTLVTEPFPRADAIALVAFAHGYGRGVPQDFEKAFQWAEWGAAKGSADAKYQVGMQYYSGMGVKADAIAGYVNVLAAAVTGHVEARIIVATSKAAGFGTAQDVPEGINELEAIRAEKKDTMGNAAFNLAMIKMGNAKPEYYDRATASHLFAEAAQSGNTVARFFDAMLEAELLADPELAREKIGQAFRAAQEAGVPQALGFIQTAKGDMNAAVEYFLQTPKEVVNEAEIVRRIAELGRPAGDNAPRPVYLPPPRYPFIMMLQALNGKAVVEFVIDVNGRVKDTRLISDTHTVFGRAAVETVKNWRFAPGIKGGRPVDTFVSQPIEFALENLAADAAK